ncbi:MICOS complex subunit MIC19 isoform X5 [Trichechus manatus latirostris]|uniref:MICOS complex subunit MIC19 isoform X5 n=1 Tax=Trichechus manatus latirostris TaxID=127582 RepID=A0A2Y9RC26_TRIMA|nr:MICOS complex subunit MIC19 isoform X5 [Trichechus manatus latirostris]
MGGTASTRRVTFEADENENITVVKGIRLSENVIDRMKEASPSGSKSPRHSGGYGASAWPSLHFLTPEETPEQEHTQDHLNSVETVSEEELKRRVAEELALEQAKKESEKQKQLKQSKELDQESAHEQLTRAILRERISSEEERSRAKHLSAEFYKVTTEQYQKATEEVEAKFKRYDFHPVCADLQAQILQCYRQHTHQTLSCSALAAQYMHCVNQAKQGTLEKGG